MLARSLRSRRAAALVALLVALLAAPALAQEQPAQQLQIEQPAPVQAPPPAVDQAVQDVPADDTQIAGQYQETGEGGQAVVAEQQSEVSTDSAFGLGDWGAMNPQESPTAAPDAYANVPGGEEEDEGSDMVDAEENSMEGGNPGCQINPINNQLCGGEAQGYCQKEANTCICHEVDDKTGWFGDSCECGFAKEACNPQHCHWCESVHECVLDERDCMELEHSPEAQDLREGEEGEDEGSYDDEEGSYDDRQDETDIPALEIDRDDWAGSSPSTLLFFVLLIGATGVAFYFIRAKGMSRARREYGQLRSDEL